MEKSLKLTTLAIIGAAIVSQLTSNGSAVLASRARVYHIYEGISKNLWEGYTPPATIPVPIWMSQTEREKSWIWLFFNDLNYISDLHSLYNASVTSLCK